ncbi:hypothetical protein SADO_16583 [Salinisphaera dokdonensis CL-ES53]|uniref:ABC transporter permease n=1 Tax=Salinisphaera dokdonensis CL-ES53 TaxID=1304272 RepID=A0ABV2B604_9GAMM
MKTDRTSAMRLAWRQLGRSRRDGAGWILLIALVVAVAAVGAVSQMTDRVRSAMVRQGAATLAADLKLDLRAPLDDERARQLDAAGVQHHAVTVFPSVVSRDDEITLVSVKAVEDSYPMRGTVTLRRGAPGSPTEVVSDAPDPGTAWVAQRILDAQQLEVGDELALGDTRLTIAAVLAVEPDRGNGFANIAPRVLIHQADVAATGLLGPGSRASYAELIAGTPDAVSALRAELEPELQAGERLQTPAESNRALSRALERADVFLDLAALVAVVLAGVAIALTARQHAESRLDEIALLKTLGAARGLIARLLAWQLVFVGVIGIGLGLAVAGLAQLGISRFIARAFEIELPGASWLALWPAAATGAILLAGFAWPALSQARATPPARVLARSLAEHGSRTRLIYAAALVNVIALAAAATRDLTLTAWVVAATVGGTALLWGAALLLLAGVERLRQRLGHRTGPGLRLGLAALSRRRNASALQIVAFGIGLTMLFMLVIVRGDLLAGWQADIAADAPNRFLINITREQQPQVADRLESAGLDADFYPLVRGRLTAVDGTHIEDNAELAEQAGELTRRELNLSWIDDLKNDNRIVAGQWFEESKPDEPKMSIDTSVAERLDVGVGDSLTFDITGTPITATVESIREIDWSSLQANFYVLFSPGVLDEFAATYITSLYVPADAHGTIATLVREFSNISVIDIAAILDQLTTLIDRLSVAIELVFGFTLAAGLVVLLAAMQASRAERLREAALLRALGARSRWLRQATVAECLLIGLCASLMAAVIAQTTSVVLAVWVFDLDYAWRPHLWLIAIGVATAVIAVSGLLSLRDVLRQPAWASLRAAD